MAVLVLRQSRFQWFQQFSPTLNKKKLLHKQQCIIYQPSIFLWINPERDTEGNRQHLLSQRQPKRDTHRERHKHTHTHTSSVNISSIQRKMWWVPGRMCAVCRLNYRCVHFWIREGEKHTVHTECLLFRLQTDKHTRSNLGLTLQKWEWEWGGQTITS